MGAVPNGTKKVFGCSKEDRNQAGSHRPETIFSILPFYLVEMKCEKMAVCELAQTLLLAVHRKTDFPVQYQKFLRRRP